MNVEIFTLSISRKAGGVKDAVKDLFLHHEFSQQGVKLHISSYHDIASDIDKEEWTPLPLSLYKSKTFFGYSKAIKQALLQSNADLLHVHGLWRYPHAFMHKWKQEKNQETIDFTGGELPESISRDTNGYLCGETGCGLCALYQLQEAGITHLKLVGRGNYTDFMEKDIRNLRRALSILEVSDSNVIYRQNLKEELFPYGCSENCYYKENFKYK